MNNILKRLNANYISKIADIICDIWENNIDEKECLISFDEYARYIRKNYNVFCTTNNVNIAWSVAYDKIYGLSI